MDSIFSVNGELIKKTRKEKHLTQKQLCEGICKQSTISNIERNNFCSSIEIIGSICSRINLSISDVIVGNKDNEIKKILDEIENLTELSKNKEAFELLESIDHNNLTDVNLMKKYIYSKGMLLYLYQKETEGPIFYLNKVLEMSEKNELMYVLSLAGLGMIYSEKQEELIADEYYNTIEEMITNMNPIPLRIVKTIYNMALYRSKGHNFQEAIRLCDLGIEICNNYKSLEILEYLLYEKAYNLREIDNKDYKKYYRIAYSFAEFKNNQHIINTINSDLSRKEDKLSILKF